MPIAELLALYNCSVPPVVLSTPGSSSKRSTRSRGRRSSRLVAPTTNSKDTVIESKNELVAESKGKGEKMQIEEEKLKEIKKEKPISPAKKNSDNVKTETSENGSDAIKQSDAVQGLETDSKKENAPKAGKPEETKKKNKAADDKSIEPMSVDDDLNGYVEEDEDEDDDDDEEEEEEESDLRKLYPETYKVKEKRLLRSEFIL